MHMKLKVLKWIYRFSLIYIFVLITSLPLYMYIGSSSTPTTSENFVNCTMSESSPAASVSCPETLAGKLVELWSTATVTFLFITFFGLFHFLTFLIVLLIWSPIFFLLWWVLKGRHLTSCSKMDSVNAAP